MCVGGLLGGGLSALLYVTIQQGQSVPVPFWAPLVAVELFNFVLWLWPYTAEVDENMRTRLAREAGVA